MFFGDSRDGDISIDSKNEVLAVRRPILLNCNIEAEGGDLEQVATRQYWTWKSADASGFPLGQQRKLIFFR